MRPADVPVTAQEDEEMERAGQPYPRPIRSCNRHDDCDAANESARAAGRFGAEHCHDECCEDCFGS